MSKKKSETIPDVIVIGAGPAGTTAALRLASMKRSVLLLDGAAFPRSKPCAGWFSARGGALLAELGVPTRNLLQQTIDSVTFCDSEVARTARPTKKVPLGHLIDRTAFDAALVAAARKQGATFRDRHVVTGIEPGESGVTVHCHERESLRCRNLIVATGISRQLLEQAGLHLASEADPVWTVHVDEPKPSNGDETANVVIVVGATPDNGFCLAVERPDSISLTLNGKGDPPALTRRLIELAGALAAKGHVSVDLSKAAATARCMPTFPFSALDVDSHVGKHTLVIGDAGGFHAAASHEGIYPAMWSAMIAARVVDEASDSEYPQDALMTFDTKWRLEMADFLRPPNTDLKLLLPLIFTNQPMADRMAAAFFGGENI